jgi:fructan beta-fructosidase
MTRRPAFVILELLVVLSIVSVLSAVALPKIVSSIANSKAAQCVANRQIIEQAETRYRLEHDDNPSSSINALKDGNYLDRIPYCTAGGAYVWVSTITSQVGCSVHYWPFEIAADAGTGTETSTAGTTPASTTLFASGFDSLDMIKVLSGRWVIASDVLKNISSGEARVAFGEDTWKDYTLTLNATLDRGDGYGVYYRADGEADISGYVFQYDPGWGGGAFLVRKVVDGNESPPLAVAEIPSGFPVYDVQHQISVSVVGDKQEIYVDSVKVLTLTDSTYTSGSAGLRTWDSTRAEFDAVAVTTG